MHEKGFEDKKVSEVITSDTKILTAFREGFDIMEYVLEHVVLVESGPYAVLYNQHYVICFKESIPVALFHVYDLRYCNLNAERGFVNASGHESMHEYWFDNGEYNCS